MHVIYALLLTVLDRYLNEFHFHAYFTLYPCDCVTGCWVCILTCCCFLTSHDYFCPHIWCDHLLGVSLLLVFSMCDAMPNSMALN